MTCRASPSDCAKFLPTARLFSQPSSMRTVPSDFWLICSGITRPTTPAKILRSSTPPLARSTSHPAKPFGWHWPGCTASSTASRIPTVSLFCVPLARPTRRSPGLNSVSGGGPFRPAVLAGFAAPPLARSSSGSEISAGRSSLSASCALSMPPIFPQPAQSANPARPRSALNPATSPARPF